MMLVRSNPTTGPGQIDDVNRRRHACRRLGAALVDRRLRNGDLIVGPEIFPSNASVGDPFSDS